MKYFFTHTVASFMLCLLFPLTGFGMDQVEAPMLATVDESPTFQMRKGGMLDFQLLKANADTISGIRTQTFDKIILVVLGTPIEFVQIFHKKQGDDIVTWKGTTADESCTLILTLGTDHFFGNALCSGTGQSVQFEPYGNGLDVASYISDPSSEIPLQNDTDAPSSSQTGTTQEMPESPIITTAGPQDDGSRIDVMVLYTKGLANDHPGTQIHTRIQYLVDLANDAYTNSQINTQLQLVYSQQVNYPDSLDVNSSDYFTLLRTAASELKNNSGVFAGIEGLRTQYGADHVTLLRKLVNEGCGFTWFTAGGAGGAASSYSIVHDGSKGIGGSCNVRSYAHEIGHTFGCDHNVANASGGRAFSYSYGYVDSTEPNTFRTIMAYGNKSMIPYFSNPNLTYNAEPIGTSVADNAATINTTRVNVAKYRTAVFIPPITSPNTSFLGPLYYLLLGSP